MTAEGGFSPVKKYSRKKRGGSKVKIQGFAEGHRKAHRHRDTTSFSSATHSRGIKRLSPTRNLRVSRHAPDCCVPTPARSFLLAPSTLLFEICSHASQLMGACCQLLPFPAQRLPTSKPLPPEIQSPEGPRPPQPRAATSKRLYRTRAELPTHLYSSA